MPSGLTIGIWTATGNLYSLMHGGPAAGLGVVLDTRGRVVSGFRALVRRSLLGVMLLGGVLLALSGAAHAQVTVYVDDDACPGPGTGALGDPFCNIQDAICDIKDTGGGTVLVSPGTYNESLRMSLWQSRIPG